MFFFFFFWVIFYRLAVSVVGLAIGSDDSRKPIAFSVIQIQQA